MIIFSFTPLSFLPPYFFPCFIFIFGLCAGSFLNCVIYRLENKKRKNLWGRSFCPKCRHKLGFFDLIPILSFVFLKGKCRYCREKISWRYPIVEILTGLIFLFILWHLGFGFDLTFGIWILKFLYLTIISLILIVVFIYDLKHHLIPEKFLYAGILLIFLFRILIFGHWDLIGRWSLVIGIWQAIKMPLFSGIFAGLFFFLIWLASRGHWLGFGDVILAFFMGLFLGFPAILTALFSAFFIGAIIGLGLIGFGKKKLGSQVPFGPFLAIGTFIALFWSKEIISWYINLL